MIEYIYDTATRTKAVISQLGGVYSLEIFREVDLPPNSGPDKCLCVNSTDLFRNESVYVIDSIKSGLGGRNDHRGVYAELVGPVLSQALSIKHTYLRTNSADLIRGFASRLSRAESNITLAIIGGDTSINEFINAFNGEGNSRVVKIIVFPAGTGNAFALSLNINNNVEALASLLGHTSANEKPLQMYRVTFPPNSTYLYPNGSQQRVTKPILFLVVFSWAFHASLVADSDLDELRKAGIERFKIAAIRNLEWRQEYNGKVTIVRKKFPHQIQGDARDAEIAKLNVRTQAEPGTHSLISKGQQEVIHNGPFAYLVVTPAQKFEPTFEISPRGDILNDQLYVVGFNTEDTPNYIMDVMNDVYNRGSHVNNKKVFYDRVEASLVIKLQILDNPKINNRRFCVDGAIINVPNSHGEIEIEHYGSSIGGCQFFVVSALEHRK